MVTYDQNVRYDGTPSVLVFSDDAGACEAAETLIGDVFGWSARTGVIDNAVARLDTIVVPAAVLVDVRRDGGDPLDRLLDRLDLAARQDRHASVICLPCELVDVVAARAFHPRVELLVEASPAERALAIGAAARGPDRASPLLAEDRGAPTHLMQLSEEVGRIARTLAQLSTGPEAAAARGSAGRGGPIVAPSATTVRAAIRARRLRDQFFDAELFADPAWDMLLDLFAARLESRPVAVSSLCIAAAVPPTTALRWMKQLTDEGLFVRIADPRDGRRVFIELSDQKAASLSDYFLALGRMGVALP